MTGVQTCALPISRLDPILPGVTNGAECLEPLCAALARIGVRTIAASVLFLRPAVIGSLRRHVKDKRMLNRMLDYFAGSESNRSSRAERSQCGSHTKVQPALATQCIEGNATHNVSRRERKRGRNYLLSGKLFRPLFPHMFRTTVKPENRATGSEDRVTRLSEMPQ